MNFGYVYGLGFFGSLVIYFLVNVMIGSQYIMLYTVISILGYCSSPIVVLSLVNLALGLKTAFGAVLIVTASLLATVLAVRILDTVGSLGL
jgi:hypothetical protein